MILLSKKYYGSICRCNNCGALYGYKPEDVDTTGYMRCTQCGFSIKVPLNITYDGVIKDDNNNNNTDK